MEEKKINCITTPTVREAIRKAQELNIKREELVNIFSLGELIYLIYYK